MRKTTKFKVWAVVGRPFGDMSEAEEVWHWSHSESRAREWAYTHELNSDHPARVVRLTETMSSKGKVSP